MDFIDQLKQLAVRAEQLRGKINTEEATKTSLILPFFQALGYDVFNPMEFTPEYVADVGIKKGEKVDYAILQNDAPVILIEAKWCGEPLDSHDSQLFRYFGTSPAKFAILTNGLNYRFYTDLDESNKMDLVPFMEFDLLDIKEELIPEIKKFQKASLDIDAIFSSASDLKYSNAIKKLFAKEFATPSDAFVNYVLGEVYEGHRTQKVVDKFKDIVKRAFTQWVNNILNEKFQNAMQSTENTVASPEEEAAAAEAVAEEPQSKIITTAEELDGFSIIKSFLYGTVDLNLVTYKDTESYFGILYNNNVRKWICRLFLDGSRKSIVIPDAENQNGTRYYIESNNDIYSYKDAIVASVKRFVEPVSE
jgi:Uncharacterized conserved protein